MQNLFTHIVELCKIQQKALLLSADALMTGAGQAEGVIRAAAQSCLHQQRDLAQTVAAMHNDTAVADLYRQVFLSYKPGDATACQKEIARILSETQIEMLNSVHELMLQVGSPPDAASSVTAGKGQAHLAGLDPIASMASLWKSVFSDAIALGKENLATASATMPEPVTCMAASADSAKAALHRTENEASRAGNKTGNGTSKVLT